MIRVEVLLRTPAVTLALFDHPPGEAHDDPPGERSPHDSIAFVESGSFIVGPAGRRAERPWAFGPGMLFVAPSDVEFSCTHACECPEDRCLSVTYTRDAVEDLRTAGVAPLALAAVRGTARQRFLRHRLRSCADTGGALRLELVAAALFESLAPATGEPSPRSIAPLADVTRRVARAAELIEAEYARPLALGEIAGAAGMSPYHFARVFRRLTGLPPHRYLVAVRLRHALERLDQGASVTETCYAVGFASLSHFITTFRRRFGISPSALDVSSRRPTALRAALAAPVWTRRGR
jgi:AraC-like DNA-binding protein